MQPRRMQRPTEQTAPSTQDFLEAAGPRLAELCTGCGACFAACPIVDVIGLRNADKGDVTRGIRLLARGVAGPEESVRWAGACAKSGLCRSACPERDKGLDAMLLVRIARQHALTVTHQIAPKHDATAFPRVKVFARLQLTDEEQKKWL